MIQEKVAIITGGSRGIGYGIAEKLATEGYSLAIFGTSSLDGVEDSIKGLEEYGGRILYVQGSLKESGDRHRLVDETLNEFGRIDVLVNNAGVAPKVRMDILETTESSFDFVVDTNLKGTFFLTQRVANEMIKQKEQEQEYVPMIINIGSLSSYTSSPSRGEYCVSKAGISMVTKLFAHRLAEFGISVHEIRPGIIETHMTSSVKDKYDTLIADGLFPIKRWGYPEDVAKAVLALCSGILPYSTGEIINVDGGFHLRRL
ncbi:MAG TPA: 3-ketoacyl-ACP reductase [Clostridia bacterium]|nr:3-ketoacyl-ACP reductase [Clostridia bacterium]